MRKGAQTQSVDEMIIREWLDHLKDLHVETKKMFGCCCLYCDGQAVGWIHDSVMSLREVGLDYLPDEIKRPGKEDRIQELVIPLEYANSDWLPREVQDTADIRKSRRYGDGTNHKQGNTGRKAR